MEEELMKIVDKEYSRLSKNTLKQLQHKDVFTGNDEKSSSSSEDDEERVLPPIERMNLLKFYRKDKPNHSRSKSR